MDWGTVAAAVAVVTPVGGLALYVVRSEVEKKVGTVDGRIAAHEAGCAVRQSNLAETLKEIKDQGHRLEDKIDRLVGMP